MVPTMISESAVDTRSQMDKRDAIRASPSHNEAKAQMPVMVVSASVVFVRDVGSGGFGLTKNPPVGGFRGLSLPPQLEDAVGVISHWRFWGTPSPSDLLSPM